ncbi:MAG: hypothetical protein AAB922_03340 [Patescibacteria group bacterium]
MKYKEEIEKLKDGECYIVPESDYGKAEIWLKNEMYFLFEIPTFGGQPRYVDNYIRRHIDIMIKKIESWT